MFGLGTTEIIVLLILAVVLFGDKFIKEAAGRFGKLRASAEQAQDIEKEAYNKVKREAAAKKETATV